MTTAAVIARVAAQSAVIHAAADVLGQSLERWGVVSSGDGAAGAASEVSSLHSNSATTSTTSGTSWDAARTARFALVGGTLHGPYFGVGFAFLDRWLGASRSVGNVARKVVATQVSFSGHT
jgi:hypothetical protein